MLSSYVEELQSSYVLMFSDAIREDWGKKGNDPLKQYDSRKNVMEKGICSCMQTKMGQSLAVKKLIYKSLRLFKILLSLKKCCSLLHQ